MKRILSATIILISLIFISCAENDSMTENPFFEKSELPLEAPQFDAINDDHYLPALLEGIGIEKDEIGTIADNTEPPTFDNTIVAMEKTGALLNRVQSVFFNMTSAHTNQKIQEIQAEIAPKLAAHSDDIYLNRALFERVETLYNKKDELGLDPESLKLLDDTYRDFIRAGAKLSESGQKRVREINERLSSLTTEFQEKLLEMTRERSVLIDTEDELEGLSSDRIRAAKQAAEEQGHEGKYLLSITNTTRQPVLTSLKRRDVREKVWKASAYRGVGENGGVNTQPLLLEMVKLRSERAQLLGYENYATYALDPQTAENPGNVLDMLTGLIDPLNRNVNTETESIRDMMRKDGIQDEVQAWDWQYYAEKVRSERYDIDENEVRAYFELDRVLKDGVFYTMNRLFGITFEERTDLPVYHPDVRVFDVYNEDGSRLGLFYGDFFARDSKRGGAWMSSYVSQSHLLDKKPVIVNVLNIPKPAAGEPALISFDNATTLFHEMGHAVHGLFSDVKYPSQSGTSVPRDYVEFPSTFQEDWAIHPEVLANYAVHYETGETIPQDLLNKLIEAREFNQGFDTYEYLASTLVDMQWHLLNESELPENVSEFERETLSSFGLTHPAIPPRYKSPYFAHIFSGGYSANYYSYIWSEILAADAFAFMRENGGLNRENGEMLRTHILSKGGSQRPMDLYYNFRNGEPEVKNLLERRGLAGKEL